MIRKFVGPPLAVLTLALCWMATWMVKNNPTTLALAQAAGKASERTTVLINRKPVRVIGDDPYSNFTGVAVDEQRGHPWTSVGP